MLEYYMSPTEAHYKVAADAALAAGLAISPAAFQPLLYEAAERYERLKKQGLDAMIACYLTLEGAEGLPLVEDLFLKDPNGDYKDIFSAIYALRFHGEETDAIPRARLLEAMRLVLDNPTFADQVIADLSRWEDWGAMDRLAEMFKAADKSSYVRQPIAAYMLIAAEQEGDVGTRATAHLADLREVDRQAIDDAERNMGFGLFAPAMPRSSDVASADASAASETTRTENAVPDVAAAQPPETGEAAASEPRESTQDGETTVALASEAQREAPVEASANAVADESASEPESQPAETAIADTAESAAEADERAPDDQSTHARQPTSPAESTEPINPPSRPLIFGATALAVAVLAGLFALLLRGFAR
jgi:hypothetical protein